jgi:DNA-binding LacI/PurR family transcriptional regulator
MMNDQSLTTTTPEPSLSPVSEAHRERVEKLLRKLGSLPAAARLLKVSALTAAKAAGGQPVSRGTRALIAQRIAELDAANARP